MLLFRIENISDCDAVRRTYNPNEFQYPELDELCLDTYIAEEIRKEVNGATNRNVLSYSKSLAVCLLKYNPYADNELHILPSFWKEGDGIRRAPVNSLRYADRWGKLSSMGYSLWGRINNRFPLYFPCICFTLRDFIVDVSNNGCLREYLIQYTRAGKGLSSRVSPEKDCEVIVMNPPVDFAVSGCNIEAVYILYALHMQYGFLSKPFSRDWLIKRLYREAYMGYSTNEIMAFVMIVYYLSNHWQYEYEISQKIYDYAKKAEKKAETVTQGAFCYSGINFFENILKANSDNIREFKDMWAIDCDYQHSPISELCWQACYNYLKAKN